MEISIIKKNKSEDYRMQKLNVAAYVRVSTKFEEQIYSYESQIKYYTNLITRNINWNLVKIYADYGITGKSYLKRDEFINMINDALNGKIDLIITKSISRFSRNTLDLLKCVRTLKYQNIGVFFEEENINTLTLDGELLLTILSSVAQNESENIGSHISYSRKMMFEKGIPIRRIKFFGYDVSKDKTLVINHEEAEVVKKIFDLYENGLSLYSINKFLRDYYNKISVKLKRNWCNKQLMRVLTNEDYIGNLVQGRSSKDKEIYIIENDHEGIITKEQFYRVQRLIEENTIKNQNYYKRKYNFDNFPNNIYCGFCKCKFIIAKKQTGTLYYACSKLNLKTQDSCHDSKMVEVKIVISSFMECINKIINKKINLYNKKNEIKLIKERIKIDNYKLEELVEKLIDKKINMNNYLINKNRIEKEKSKLNFLYNNKLKEYKHILEIYKSKIKIMKIIYGNGYNLNTFNINMYNSIVKYAFIGEIKQNGNNDPYIIKYYFDDKKEWFINEEIKSFNENNYIPLIKFFYKYNYRSLYAKKNKKGLKGIDVIFYVRKD